MLLNCVISLLFSGQSYISIGPPWTYGSRSPTQSQHQESVYEAYETCPLIRYLLRMCKKIHVNLCKCPYDPEIVCYSKCPVTIQCNITLELGRRPLHQSQTCYTWLKNINDELSFSDMRLLKARDMVQN